MNQQTENVNVVAQELLPTPATIKRELEPTEEIQNFVNSSRETILGILNGTDKRMLVVVGPCSIHDIDAGVEYARRLKKVADNVQDTLYVIMRAYFEKPRTTIGWKGLINDPYLNDSFEVEKGIRLAREFLLTLNEMKIPVSTEALDPIVPQYLQDLIAWSAIGARTTESQTHREMASGLSSIVGFKNGTDGGLEVAFNALESVSRPHRFLGINQLGQVAVIHTSGNPGAHIVLRGGSTGPNYDVSTIRTTEQLLRKRNLKANIMVDCSHANSDKDHHKQIDVAMQIAHQIENGNDSIIGLMLESNLEAGNQKLTDKTQLRYGVSITDACIGWDETEHLLRSLAKTLHKPLDERRNSTASRAA